MSTAEGRRYVRTDRFASLKDHIYAIVFGAGAPGRTVVEVVNLVNEQTPQDFFTYSNPVSGALSRLHNVDQKIVRLKEKRGGFDIYVHPTVIMGREYHLPRPPDGKEGDRLTPALVLEVLDGIRALIPERDFLLKNYVPTINGVWTAAKQGDVSRLQAAIDEVRGREVGQ